MRDVDVDGDPDTALVGDVDNVVVSEADVVGLVVNADDSVLLTDADAVTENDCEADELAEENPLVDVISDAVAQPDDAALAETKDTDARLVKVTLVETVIVAPPVPDDCGVADCELVPDIERDASVD